VDFRTRARHFAIHYRWPIAGALALGTVTFELWEHLVWHRSGLGNASVPELLLFGLGLPMFLVYVLTLLGQTLRLPTRPSGTPIEVPAGQGAESAERRPHRVLIVDNGTLMEECILNLLRGEADLEVSTTGASSEPELAGVIQRTHPDVVILQESASRVHAARLLALLGACGPVRLVEVNSENNFMRTYDSNRIWIAQAVDLLGVIRDVPLGGPVANPQGALQLHLHLHRTTRQQLETERGEPYV
jgi:hypothetical protein